MSRTIAVADIGGTHARFALAEVANGHVVSLGEPVTPNLSFIRNGRIIQGLLVSFNMSPPTGPAKAMPSASGSSTPATRPNSCQAIWKLA